MSVEDIFKEVSEEKFVTILEGRFFIREIFSRVPLRNGQPQYRVRSNGYMIKTFNKKRLISAQKNFLRACGIWILLFGAILWTKNIFSTIKIVSDFFQKYYFFLLWWAFADPLAIVRSEPSWYLNSLWRIFRQNRRRYETKIHIET